MAMERSHIWVGTFPSEQSLADYFKESYSEDDDDKPINRFAQDQGELFYDHDWVERGFRKIDDIRELIINFSYYEDYIDDVVEAIVKNKIADPNTFIVADKDEFKSPRSIEGADYKIWYLGIYTCNT
jgi:hypothetical protein